MNENTQSENEILKSELVNYRTNLLHNPKKWFIEQIKYNIVVGRRILRVTYLDSSQFKKLWFPLISSKKIKPDEIPYYDKNANILITDNKCRKNIDFIKELGLSWCVGLEWDDSLFSIQRNTLNVICF
jgi:hypothetical protein